MRHVAFVRNVMIGREGLHRVVLLDAVTSVGGVDPVNHVSTGNVALTLDPDAVPDFEEALSAAIEPIIGRVEPVYVRPIARLVRWEREQIFASAPWEPRERVVCFAKRDFGPTELPLFTPRQDAAILRFDGRDAVTVSRELNGRIGSPAPFLEKRYACKVTSRSWNTLARIARKEG